ncbi:hypothetical protein GQ55_9G397400 [Panicum hallii var. hallii]|uniref:Uncharacterized protein n=1 Tax=Panicum hallii var. hallii TaxID=1504633 RepID=A0A2T7C9T8_9POAL|nr:hypothetical protein GQ55_9G397400 [Panicum hallii var. hallii]
MVFRHVRERFFPGNAPPPTLPLQHLAPPPHFLQAPLPIQQLAPYPQFLPHQLPLQQLVLPAPSPPPDVLPWFFQHTAAGRRQRPRVIAN